VSVRKARRAVFCDMVTAAEGDAPSIADRGLGR
jgi:hypothetical protein